MIIIIFIQKNPSLRWYFKLKNQNNLFLPLELEKKVTHWNAADQSIIPLKSSLSVMNYQWN